MKTNNIKFKTTLINHQEWMSENLDVSHFNNGDPILHAESNEQWVKAAKTQTPAWCFPSYNGEILDSHGKLYNKFAVYDPRGLAPEGFFIPTIKNYVDLVEMLGGHNLAAIKLKSKTGWANINLGYSGKIINGCGTNEYDFNAEPIPYRDDVGVYHISLDTQSYWSIDDYPGELEIAFEPFKKSLHGESYVFSIGNDNFRFREDYSQMSSFSKGGGLPIRCVKEVSQSDNRPLYQLLESHEEYTNSYWRLLESFYKNLQMYKKHDTSDLEKALRKFIMPEQREGRQDDKF